MAIINDEKLIEGVRDFPYLWQVSSIIIYMDIKAKVNTWKQVAMSAIHVYTLYCKQTRCYIT